jgi:hypothetical protein
VRPALTITTSESEGGVIDGSFAFLRAFVTGVPADATAGLCAGLWPPLDVTCAAVVRSGAPLACRPVWRTWAVATCLVAAAGCGGGSGNAAAPAATSTADPSATSTGSTAPTRRTTTTTAAPACPPFHGTTAPRVSSGPKAPGLLVSARAGGTGCLDEVVFEFRSLGDGTPAGVGLAPGYSVGYRDQSVMQFTDGNPPVAIAIPGRAVLVVKIAPAASVDNALPDHPATYTGNLLLRYTGQHHLEIVRKRTDIDGAVVWYIGLDGERPFTVDAARDPTRIRVLIG